MYVCDHYPEEGIVASGTRQVVKFSLKLPEANDQSAKTINLVIHSNDKRNPQVLCTAKANVKQAFKVVPKRVNQTFYDEFDLKEFTFDVTVAPTSSEMNPDEIAYSYDQQKLKLEQKSVVDDALKLTFRSSESQDMHSLVKFLDPKSGFSSWVPVSLHLKEELTIYPSKLILDPADSSQTFEVTIVNQRPEQQLKDIQLVNPGKHTKIDKITNLGLNKKRIRVTLNDWRQIDYPLSNCQLLCSVNLN